MDESKTLIRRLIREGWEEVSRKGSHATFKKQGVPNLITIPDPRRDLPKGLRRAIEKAAGWR